MAEDKRGGEEEEGREGGRRRKREEKERRGAEEGIEVLQVRNLRAGIHVIHILAIFQLPKS